MALNLKGQAKQSNTSGTAANTGYDYSASLPSQYNPSYSNIISQISQMNNIPSLTKDYLPQVQQLLGQSSQYLQPSINAINQNTQQNVAQTQSNAQKRGVTGSSVEQLGISQAQQGGAQQIQQLMGQWGLQNSQQMASYVMQAASGDIQTQKETIQSIAQAMGQELTSQRDYQEFQQQLQAALSEAQSSNSSNILGSVIQGLGSVGGGVAKGLLS